MSRTHGSPRRSIAVIASLVMLIAVAFSVLSGPPAHADTVGASMSLSVAPGNTVPCPDGKMPKEAAPMVCVATGAQFTLFANADAIPADGYVLAQVWIHYGDGFGAVGGVKGPPIGHSVGDPSRVTWPDCDATTFIETQRDQGGTPAEDSYSATCITAYLPPQPASFYKGQLFAIDLTCPPTAGNHIIELIQGGEAPAGTSGALFIDANNATFYSAVQDIEVNCVEPAVGGIALDDGLALPGPTSGRANAWWFATAMAALPTVAGISAFVAVRRRGAH